MNPLSGETDAVTEPLFISVEIRASIASFESAVNGISNNSAPLPLKVEPLFTLIPPLTNSEPVNCEPLPSDSTLNPKSGETEAVTLPLAILNESPLNADCGILNNPSPLPLKNPLPDGIVTLPSTDIEPLNVEPLSAEFTTNPLLGETDAVTEPLAILNASPVN